MLFAFSVLLVLGSCNSNNAGSPKNTVSAFIDASKEGNLEEVKKHISKSDLSLIQMGENFLAALNPTGAKDMKDKMAKEFKEKTANADINIGDEKIDGDKATVDVSFKYEGKSETRPFSLIKEDGKWKVSLMSTGMKNAGTNEAEIKETIKNINIDSIQQALKMGMDEMNKIDKDSMKIMMQQAAKEIEKLKVKQ